MQTCDHCNNQAVVTLDGEPLCHDCCRFFIEDNYLPFEETLETPLEYEEWEEEWGDYSSVEKIYRNKKDENE